MEYWLVSVLCVFTSWILLVHSDNIQVDTPPLFEIHELGDVSIMCHVTGTNQSVDYKWTKAGEVDIITRDAMLILENVHREQAGDYTCDVIVNTAPPWMGSSTTLIRIQYLPRWVTYAPRKFAGHLDQTATLECQVLAYPEVSFYWEFQGHTYEGDSKEHFPEDHYTDIFPVSPVTEATYGTYQCEATNYFGNVTGIVTFDLELLPPGKPDVPHWCELLNVTAFTASIECLPGYDGGDNPHFPVEKSGPLVPPGDADSSFTITDDGLVLVEVTGLLPLTNYTLQVFAANIHGRSEGSYGVDAWTVDGVIPPPETPDEFPLAYLIGAVVCSALFLVFVVLLVVCLVRRGKIAKEKARRRAECPEYEENINNRRQERESQKRTGSFRSTSHKGNGGSFRSRGGPVGDSARFGFGPGSRNQKKRSWGHQGGAAYNIAYNMSSSDTEGPDRLGPRDSNIFHIAGANTGETDMSFSNEGYSPELTETSFGGRAKPPSVNHPDLPPRYDDIIPANSPLAQNMHSDAHVYTDALRNKQRLSLGQPDLAGQGALTLAPMLSLNSSHQPLPLQTQPGGFNGNNRRNPQSDNRMANANNQSSKQPGPTLKQDYAAVHPRDVSYNVPEEVWEFPKEKLYIRQKIGEGLVGEVWRARAQGILGRDGEVLVAVKMLKDDNTEEEYRALIRELRVMKMLQPHPNIVSLLGQCTVSEPPFIIMEYCTNGNLQQLLRCQRLPDEDVYRDRDSHYASMRYRQRLTSRDLVVFALHVARGMEYVSSKEFLHRDLAARNVLVDENLICKISDFGLARDVAKSRQYESRTQGRLPIRWMAPESLFDCIYSTKSDVWSFGVLLWEVVTLGSSPYPGMAGPDVMELIQMGYRMDKPKLCSDHLYAIMHDCWRHNPKQRPHFSLLVDKLESILAGGQEHDVYVEQMADNMYEIFDSLPGEKC